MDHQKSTNCNLPRRSLLYHSDGMMIFDTASVPVPSNFEAVKNSTGTFWGYSCIFSHTHSLSRTHGSVNECGTNKYSTCYTVPLYNSSVEMNRVHCALYKIETVMKSLKLHSNVPKMWKHVMGVQTFETLHLFLKLKFRCLNIQQWTMVATDYRIW